jgi:hypothetical protein
MPSSISLVTDKPTQTTPVGEARKRLSVKGLPGEGGTEIPVPKRDVMDALRKAAKVDQDDGTATHE